MPGTCIGGRGRASDASFVLQAIDSDDPVNNMVGVV